MFIPSFDKNEMPLPILKPRMKHTTQLRKKDKTGWDFFSVIKKGWEEGKYLGQCQYQLFLSLDTATEDKEITYIKHLRNEFFYSYDQEQISESLQSLPISGSAQWIKLPLVTPASHIRVPVPAALLPIQPSANALGNAAENGPSIQVPATHM